MRKRNRVEGQREEQVKKSVPKAMSLEMEVRARDKVRKGKREQQRVGHRERMSVSKGV